MTDIEKTIQDYFNNISGRLPERVFIEIGIENGSAWVALYDYAGEYIRLPDAADKTIHEQIEDAITEANK